MIVLARIGNAEADGDHIEEGGLGKLRAARAEIGPGMKPQFIGAGLEIIAFENGAIDPAIPIGA